MKRDLRIDFTSEKPTILFESTTGGDLLAQKVAVNLATMQGTDKIFNSRGTNLFHDAVSGRFFNRFAIERSSILSAFDTKNFVNRSSSGDRIESCTVTLDESETSASNIASFNVRVISTSGVTSTNLKL